ncbi:bifunctional phosphopantothenoylcysteine decarboxylase/phosphopantothenate--cysteine ligase CoaBC [Aurantibacillus circumpalustris]|uniref:bifunctional phosphopantothenoylcysteine decarboxylase/phosphopantothenate--cysteine ligase CoaBC n=1 Tax=Aurantibacillus circumpalustris TaxID=3036359 RepID=UPI00295C285B|nr:bifunctional phosphopantothenoylcysteine decarboxylase/phosphopantothenate--cysteine ligase CoaBC [Aurantibacillus circumpalustris]
MLNGKKIILGITGGIAAYKCGHLVRLMVKQGAEVKVILSHSALQFITPQTLSVLSKNEVLTDFFDKNFNWNNHVHLAEWADVVLIAPLTANSLAKMASGACDSILLATYLSARTKTIVAPAMDLDMFQHPSVKKNLETLKSYKNEIIPVETGELASGLVGEGRMAEPENIVSYLNDFFTKNLPLKGKSALVNAGPTYESIDPVRFIGNRSSGKMGIAIAESLVFMGAQVTLVLGPSQVEIKNKTIKVLRVESSEEMYDAMLANYSEKDIVICSAAVADYKAANVSELKIKKKEDNFKLDLIKTKDILLELGKQKKNQCLVGFALETNNLEEYAKQKLKNKNLDLVVANSASDVGSGFSGDTNKITIIDKHNKITNFELKSKQKAASDIVNYIIDFVK